MSRPKIIYLAKGNPGLPKGGFPARWRRHGAFCHTIPIWDHLCRYEQCLTLPPADEPAARIEGATDWDGVGMIWFWSFAAMERARQEPTIGLLVADEEQTFDRVVELTALVAEDIVLRDRGGTHRKLVSFVRRSVGSTRETFLRRWQDHAAALLELPESDRVRKLVLNPAVPSGKGPMAAIDGVVEIGFDTDEDLSAFFGAEEYQELAADEVGFLDLEATIDLVTDETLLYIDPLGDERLISERATA